NLRSLGRPPHTYVIRAAILPLETLGRLRRYRVTPPQPEDQRTRCRDPIQVESGRPGLTNGGGGRQVHPCADADTLWRVDQADLPALRRPSLGAYGMPVPITRDGGLTAPARAAGGVGVRVPARPHIHRGRR